MSAAERVYRLLLRAYPAGFRAEFEREMVLVFNDQRRLEGARGPRFWAALLADVARSAPAERFSSLRRSLATNLQSGDGLMKTLGILVVVIGALEAAGAMAEGWAGGRMGDARSIVNALAGAGAGLLLVVMGVALARRGAPSSPTRVGAALCLAIFLAMALFGGRIGIAATALGVATSLALLVVSFAPRGRGSAAVARAVLFLVAALALPSPTAAQAQRGDSAAGKGAAEVPLTAAQRQAFVGTYTVKLPQGDETTLTITDVDGALMARPGNQDETHRLIHQGGNAFTVEGAPDFRMVFTVEGGRATRFALVKGDGMGEGIRSP